MADDPVEEEEKERAGIHSTASARRKIAIEALGRELDGSDPASAASRLGDLIDGPPRPMLISGDVDGLVSAAMLASVAHGWEVVGILCQSDTLVLHPSVSTARPDLLFGLDVFSIEFDNVSNHVVKFGMKKLRNEPLREAFNEWDEKVDQAAKQRLLAVPSIWAGTQGCYETAQYASSSKYKYPLGTAQILLALLEAGDKPPRFYDRDFLPWLVANCDGGVKSFTRHAYNAGIWWPTMAGAVGPASLTEQVYQRVASMGPHDFIHAVNRLDRERRASQARQWLDDEWNLVDQSVATMGRTIKWICDLTGWRDPLRGTYEHLNDWVVQPLAANQRGAVYMASDKAAAAFAKAPPAAKSSVDPAKAPAIVGAAEHALNANFYHGGFSGSRFNWAGTWAPGGAATATSGTSLKPLTSAGVVDIAWQQDAMESAADLSSAPTPGQEV